MTNMLLIKNAADLNSVPGIDRLAGVGTQDVDRHHPDEHWVIVGEDGAAAARGSIWWADTPALPAGHDGHTQGLGVIGHYAAATDEAAGLLLDHLCARLKAQGCDLAVGPMDGSTWRRYRFITDRGGEPPFFLEPDNPDGYPGQWTSAGFEPIAGYSSGATTDLDSADPRLARVRERLAASGVTLRPIDTHDFDAELIRIFDLSLIGFRGNFLYTPIDRAEFLAMYLAIRPYVRPELTIVAEEHTGGGPIPVGFLFAVPNLVTPRPDDVIIKTVAVLPGRIYAGLGALMVEECHRTAASLGYRRAIHALMYDGNESRNISSRYGEAIRRYTLFARRLPS